MEYSVEHVIKIWIDDTGERIQICEDNDGLGLTEIRYYDPDGKCQARITMDEKLTELLISGLRKILDLKKGD